MITTILWVATFLSSWRRQKYIGILKCTSKLRSSSESQLNFGRHEILIVDFAHNEMNHISSNESDVWKLNVAHVLFMQESKFKEATGFYEPIVRKNFDKYVQRSNIESILISLYIYTFAFVLTASLMCLPLCWPTSVLVTLWHRRMKRLKNWCGKLRKRRNSSRMRIQTGRSSIYALSTWWSVRETIFCHWINDHFFNEI